jgi:cyclopropane-fatty-acyl-phospholipid synthase
MVMRFNIFLLPFFIATALFMLFFFSSKHHNDHQWAQNLLEQADIQINGTRPWDITIHNENLYGRVLQEGSLGFGEAYVDGWWDCPALDQFFCKLLQARLDAQVKLTWNLVFDIIISRIINLQTKDRAFEVGERHYDLGNDLFRCMLDKNMVYSCAYWHDAQDLDAAQEKKLDLICKKLYLKPGMKVLDIGCGWGGFAYYAAKNYGVQVTGITVSQEQAEFAQQLCKDLPVTIVLQDYRDLDEKFDRVVSVGMFEHVGYKNYKNFMKIVHACLKEDGLFLLHTISGNRSMTSSDPWLTKYIFPNSMLPSICQISEAAEEFFVMEDYHNFGKYYDTTLMAWFDRFNAGWDKLKDKYGERFYRMWKYYLLSCAGLFRARKGQLLQIVFSKHGVAYGYLSVR